MFKFLKSIFEKPKEEEFVEIKENELLDWTKNKEKEILKNVDDEISAISKKMNKIISEIEEHINELKKAELKNKDIPKRAQQIMEGNRQSYISKTKIFLNKIDIESYNSIEEFIENFKSNLEILGKSNTKSNYILGEFFADITRKIALDLKSMESEVQNIKNIIAKSGLNQIRKINTMVIELKNTENNKNKLIEDIEEQEKELAASISQKERISGKLNKIRQSKEYKKFESQKMERDSIIKGIKDSEDEIIQVFGQLESGLKKYVRIAIDENTVKSFMDDPVIALKKDTELKVLDMLKGLKKNIDDGTIEMKEKKKKKTGAVIDRLSRDFIVKLQKKLTQFANDKKTKDEKIHKSSIMNDYNEQEYNLNHIEGKIEEKRKNKKILKNNLSKVDKDSIKKKIIDKFESGLNIKLEIN